MRKAIESTNKLDSKGSVNEIKTSANKVHPDSPEKAIGYIRVSSDEQAKDGLSLPSQRERIESYCKFKGYDLINIFCDEGVSGFKRIEKRPQGRLVIETLKKGEVKHFIAIKLDRCFRNTADAISKATEFKRLDINLHLFDIGVDTSTANGKLFFTIMAGLAQFERDVTGERTKTALTHLKSQGKRWNHTPYGYNCDTRGNLSKNHREQKAIRLMKHLRETETSYTDIAHELDLSGYKPKHAREWSGVAVWKILGRENSKCTE